MSSIKIYKITPPLIPSGDKYMFTTDSGVIYEVRFGRKQHNILKAAIVFGVLNDEFDQEEYVVTNRGEMYKVMATIIEVIHMYMEEHTRMISYEFTGENRQKEGEGDDVLTARTKLFLRYLKKIFGNNCKVDIKSNLVTVTNIMNITE